MVTFSEAQLAAFEARRATKAPRDRSSDEVATGEEDKLHAKILEYCQARRWVAFHGSMAHKTFRTPGEPDFEILADGGRVFLVECKTRTGKPDADQQTVIHCAALLGHTIHVVRSFDQFLAVTTT